ncbi:serine-rich adhesin for platelets-like [Anneissia japonica]|uniref:serine-rich adhesin for platelets-like n=1 Tax=Anneissia japonica TaxID=1529436 RepID=UPI001425B6BE|nr:serine-rich adhesin for platelets-like [Anneissia japonica]
MAYTWLRVTVLILVVIATNNIYAAEISFPDHVTVELEGDNAMFQCSLTLTSGEAGTSHGILWMKNDIIVIATSDSISDASGKYALDGFSTAMNTALSQTLKVTNTDISDLGTYQCIFILNTQRTNVEASARLYIRNFVPPPTCFNPTQTIVMPNDQVTLRCTADPGDPAIQMMWSPANSRVSLASSTQQFNNHLSLEYILSVPNNVQGVISYNCHTFMQGSGVTKSCTTSLLVETAQVKLLISQSPEMVMAGQDVNFICFVSDGHTPASIGWSFPNSGTIGHSTAGSTLSIFNVQSRYDGLIVTCTVNTTDGQQESETAVLNVIATTATATTTLTQHTTTLTQHTTTTTTTTMVPTQIYTMTPTALWTTLSTDRQQTLLSDGTSRSHDITGDQLVSPLNEKGDESPLSTRLIIIIAVCGSILLLVFVTCIIVTCCFLKPQAPKSAR